MQDFGTATAERPSIADRFRDSLVKRARKRVVYPSSDGWVTPGVEKLGDAYPLYTITEQEGSGGRRHHCTCQGHAGGQYRGVCSHILAVLLWKEDNDFKPAQGVGEQPQLTPPPPPGLPTPPTEREVRFDPRDGEWGHPGFPEWVTEFRPHQEDAIEDVLDAYDRGAKVVFLDAPTGSGKTLIAEAVRRKLGGQALYACTTKTLQDQFLHDYDYAAVLKGRDNYPTVLAPFPDVTAADCNGRGDSGCNWCPSRSECRYQQAKVRALGADLAVVNTAYLLNAWNGPRTFLHRELVILDECDLLEGALMGFVEVRVGPAKQRRYKIDPPAKKTVAESWLEWVRDARPKLARALAAIPEDTTDIREIREQRWLGGTLANLSLLEEGLSGEEVAWVYDQQGESIVFKPVEVDQFGEKYLWKHGRRFLVMSASIISAEEMAASLGLGEKWEVVSVPSTFPVENRPVKTVYAGRVTNKTYEDVIDDVVRYTGGIIDAHDGERILVHTVSYRMAQDLREGLTFGGHNRPIRTYSSSRDREGVLAWMKQTPGAVVLAPSFDRGVDLPGDLCTVQVIAKVPYPFLGDAQVKQRLYSTKGGQLWYSVQTVRSLVQMTGRGVRHVDDRCVTYILDRQFQDFWNRNKRLFPKWWSEALDFSGRARSELSL
jgi:Rad3-related DNA helicase